MRQLLSFAMLCMVATATVAQHHHNSWFKLAATYTVHARYKVEVDVHHRRQNGFDNHNQLDHALLYAARLSLHYSPRPSLTLSLSPLAHFSNYRVIQAKVDENAPPQSETRLAAAVSVQSKLRNKWALVNRTMAEYRMFQGRLPNSIRLRHRLGLRWEPVPKMTIGLHNELLANLPDAHARTFFDHNRLGAQVWYKLGKHLQLELGYIYINRRQRNTDVFWEEDNWLLGLVMGW